MKKKLLLLSLCSINLVCFAQLNQRFYVNTGSWKALGCYQSSLAQDLGASCAGQDGGVFNWRGIQATPTSSYNWTAPDSVVKCLQSHGIDIIPTIRCLNPNDASVTIPCEASFMAGGSGSWFPEDTAKWHTFINALTERYDNDGTSDMPGLTQPINKWRIETEWNLYWCSDSTTDLGKAKEFTKYVNMTYNFIKTLHPTYIITFAGIDSRHWRMSFFDGYTSDITYCTSNCTSLPTYVNHATLAASPVFLDLRSGAYYLMRNALYDELEIHAYGRWKHIPDAVRWIRDSITSKPIIFLEGGGPFCKACEPTNNPTDLTRDNSSYVVYYYITGLASEVQRMSWHISPEYNSFSSDFGKLDLQDSLYNKRPSYFTYRFLAKNVFSNANADTVIRITESNPALYHYQINPMAMNVAWSTNTTDSIIVGGTGTLYTWDIPTTCTSPSTCDSIFPMNTYSVSGSHTILLTNGVPVFYSWNSVLTGIENLSSANNIKVYPNPTNGIFTVILSGVEGQTSEKISTIEIINLLGEKIYSKKINTNEVEIDLSNQSQGIYFLQINSEKRSVTKKIIIQ